METVAEAAVDYKIYNRAAKPHLLGNRVLGESFETQ